MLYLSSFKIVADFLNNLNFLDISQVNSQLIFPAKNPVFAAILLKLMMITMIFFRFSLTFSCQLVLEEGIFETAASLIHYFLKGFIIK